MIDTLARLGLFEMGRLYEDNDTMILIGAAANFWAVFRTSDEFFDNAPDPLDRWSKRVIGDMARGIGGSDVYPSDGPPYAPFIKWALKTGRFWQSPTGMMVHDTAGLLVSIRGALRISGRQGLPASSKNPCVSCMDKPCIAACPVDALSDRHGYNVPACHAFLATGEGNSCMTGGCIVRRVCPVSASFGRDPAQSAFHMRAFKENTI